MRSSGLKLNISATMFLLLMCATILGNIVVVLLWQRQIVTAEVRHAQAVVGQWETLFAAGKAPMAVQAADLQQLCRAVGPSCREAAYVGDRTVVYAGMTAAPPELAEVIGEVVQANRHIVRFAGATVGGIFFGNKQLLIASPVKAQGAAAAGLGLIIDITTASQLVFQHGKIIFAWILINVLLLTIIGLSRLDRLIVRPLERLVKTSESYDYGDGVSFIGGEAGSEFGQLSFALNRMLARIEEDRKKLRYSVQSLEQANLQLVGTQKEMLRAEKLAAVGRLSAGLAHEIGNPIGIVQGYLELLENADLSPEDRLQFSRRAIAELQRIDTLIHQLLDFSRSSTQAPEPVAVQIVLAEVIEMFVSQKRVPEVRFVQQCPDRGDVVVANAADLRQVFLNCLLNAADSVQEMGEGHRGRIVVSCRCGQGDRAVVQVVFADNGRGIAADHLETIFDPFYTTKAPGKGTGLGLSVSYSIVEAAGGRIWAESSGEGAEIHIELPAER